MQHKDTSGLSGYADGPGSTSQSAKESNVPEQTEDQKRLCTIVAEIDALLKKHEVAGVCFVASKESAAWVHHLPKWTGIIETPIGLDLNLADDGHIDAIRAENAMHVLGCLRDMAHDCTTIYGRLFRYAKQHLRVIGGLIFEHEHEVETGRVIVAMDRNHEVN